MDIENFDDKRLLSDIVKIIEEENNRSKILLANKISADGECFVNQITEKYKYEQLEREEIIKYILKYQKNKIYNLNELNDCEIHELRNIKSTINPPKNFLKKIIKNFFN